MKRFLNKTIIAGALLFAGFITSCSDRDDIVTPEYDRLFSPTDLEVRVVNKINARLNWTLNKSAESYNIEVFADDNLTFAGTPEQTITGVLAEDLPYTITGLSGETEYSVRVQAVGTGIEDSKWTGIYFKTEAEQILEAIKDADIDLDSSGEAYTITLHWEAGQTATEFSLTAPDATTITYAVTANDIASGEATIRGLVGETTYTIKMLNNDKVRGILEYTTPVDLTSAIIVNAGADLGAAIAGANEGDVIAVHAGEYSIGEVTLANSVAIKGVLPSKKPVIIGSFKINSTIASLVIDNVIMDGSTSVNYPLNTNNSNCNIGKITISNSEINNYARGIFYSNTSTVSVGDVSFLNTIFKNINPAGASGGEGIDFRTGSLSSLTAENCTFNTGYRSFTRIQVTTDMAFKNCTFYKMCTVDNSNNSGLFRISGGTLEVSKCLFVGTGVDSPTNAGSGNWAKSGNVKATTTYSSNYYYDCKNIWVGQYTDSKAVDATEADPKFKDAANGDFTLGNEDLSYNKIGDSRWW